MFRLPENGVYAAHTAQRQQAQQQRQQEHEAEAAAYAAAQLQAQRQQQEEEEAEAAAYQAAQLQALQQMQQQQEAEAAAHNAAQLQVQQQLQQQQEAEVAAYEIDIAAHEANQAQAQEQLQQEEHLPPGRRPYHEPATRHDIGKMDVACSHCHALHFIGERLSISSLANPRFGSCCLQGQVKLPDPSMPPNILRRLFNGRDHRSCRFLNGIRQYNASFAFTSLAVQVDHAVLNSSGPYSFRIHGELHHHMGALLPEGDQPPRYAQLYIHDPHAALATRNANNSNLDSSIMNDIQDMLMEVNPLVPLYKRAFEILSEKPPQEQSSVQARIILQESDDQRRYNLPTINEVAAIIPGSGDEDVVNIGHHLAITRRRSQTYQSPSPLYSPLHYVLFFPQGEQGWHQFIPSNEGVDGHIRSPHVSQRCYYAYRFHPRIIQQEQDYLFRGGHLLQQYLVDAWASIEASNLFWIRTHQKDIRADLYQGLLDAMNSGDQVDLAEHGQKIVLPSSHLGSTRHMYQLFQDSMAICRHFRKPDIFLTMTANPNWPEIQEALLEINKADNDPDDTARKQTAADRPDIVVRVFKLKKEALLKKIKDGFFGNLAADVWVIEFQKRGLPHMHLLIFLEEPYKIRDAAMVDSIVSAQLPDPETQPLLYAMVTKCMLHGPCGPAHPNAPCMSENATCSKRYPRDFCEETTMGEDGYPVYARPNNGRTFTNAKGQVFTNRDVVPYNPQLSAEFDCHINVEICASVRAVKYIHKYIYKGHDKATLEVGQVDEIKEYLDARYVGPPEAMWHIQELGMHEEWPTVYRLPVHLKNEQSVYFDPEDVALEVVNREASKKTQLTEWFVINSTDPLAPTLFYQDMPEKFVWNKKTRKWTPRQRGIVIGRMHFVHPSAGEKFYLRLLLTVVKGAKSWEDLALWMTWYIPHTRQPVLRRVYWRMMESGDSHPVDPLALWNEFKNVMCDDLHHRLIAMNHPDPTEEQIWDYGLYLLNEILLKSGKNLSHFPPMPMPQLPWAAIVDNPLLQQELAYDDAELHLEVENNKDQFNAQQRTAFDVEDVERLLSAAPSLQPSEQFDKLHYVSHPLASPLSFFKIPIPVHDNSTCRIPKDGELCEVLKQTGIIIWDEVPMQHRNAVEAVDRTLRDVLGRMLPLEESQFYLVETFDRLCLLFLEDRDLILLQLPSASLPFGEISIFFILHKTCDLINHRKVRPLHSGYYKWAQAIMLLLRKPSLSQPPCGDKPDQYFLERTILSSKNDAVDGINHAILEKFPGEKVVLMAADKVIGAENAHYPIEYLNPSMSQVFLSHISH
ncbi:hypothetical protein A0H81_02325 [Grifola frondosa]|uniref:ATP-dependent DNA helicase n=1 Tax=Grifola frondosa TaxID=5627 RepID=A0A1C7MSZ4_GRIFR|nr:hypothetical protein A0H81_02325 [Grifola frondosa]